MLVIPSDVRVEADHKEEDRLLSMTRTWLEKEHRTPGIHVSDLLDPMRAWYTKKDKKKRLSDREVTTFLIGKVLHSFIITAMKEADGFNLATDEGSRHSKDLGIDYSIDFLDGKIPAEIKTSRSKEPASGVKDLAMYIEQLLCYMVAENQTEGRIWVLYINAKDYENRTHPVYRAYSVKVTKTALEEYRSQIKKTQKTLKKALTMSTPVGLTPCRTWLCGERMCQYWHKCKPTGRYGIPQSKWPQVS